MYLRAILLLALGPLTAAYADKLSDFASGQAALRRFLDHGFFQLDRHYAGELTLQHPEPKAASPDDQPQKLELNCLTPDASRYSEPDQPKPTIPALFRGSDSREQNGGFGADDFVFLDSNIPSINDLRRAATLAAVRKLAPRLVRLASEQDEQSDPAAFCYSWCRLSDTGDIEVMRIEVESVRQRASWEPDESAPLKGIRIWTGILKPARPNPAVERTAPACHARCSDRLRPRSGRATLPPSLTLCPLAEEL